MKKNKKQNFENRDVLNTFCSIEVHASECGGDANRMIKKFTKKVSKDSLFRELYDRMRFESKSSKKRKKKNKAIRAQKFNI